MAKWQSGKVMWVAMLAGLVLGACRSHSPPPIPVEAPLPESRPSDFVMAATVLSPRVMQRAELPRSLRPARYVIEADGVLRAAVGPGADETTFPGQTRQLSPREFDGLWRLVRESGLLDSGNPSAVENPGTVTREPDRTTALVYVSYEGRRRTLRVVLDRSGKEAVEAERLIDRLAGWAWVGE